MASEHYLLYGWDISDNELCGLYPTFADAERAAYESDWDHVAVIGPVPVVEINLTRD